MNTEPLAQYIKSIEAYKNGNDEEALQLLAKSIGADTHTPMMKQALGEMSNLNVAILALVISRTKGDK